VTVDLCAFPAAMTTWLVAESCGSRRAGRTGPA